MLNLISVIILTVLVHGQAEFTENYIKEPLHGNENHSGEGILPTAVTNDVTVLGGHLYRGTYGNDFDLMKDSGAERISQCSEAVQEIRDSIENGKRQIEISPEEDVIIVIGNSGVGKSTLVQFIANYSNTLRAECDWGVCKILDDSETIGDDPISKTFLPNLVTDNVTLEKVTPFYDMPGFLDNRNVLFEISNAFFIKEVLDRSKRIKLLMLSKDASFVVSDRESFPRLLKEVVKLIPDPSKFALSISLIATHVDYGKTENNFYGRCLSYLQNLNRNAGDLFDADIAETAKSILDILLMNATLGGIPRAANIGYFRSPEINGTLLNDEVFLNNKIKLQEMIWRNITFTDKTNADFGFPLSVEATTTLSRMSSCIIDNITAEIEIFATLIENDINTNITNLTNDLDVDRDNFLQILQNLTTVDYSFANEKDKPIVFYIDKIQSVIESLGGRFKGQVSLNLKNAKEYLEFIEKVIGSIAVQPSVWVKDLVKMQWDIVDKISSTSSSKIDNVTAEIKAFAPLIRNDIATNITNFANNLDVDRDNLLQILLNLTTADYSFAHQKDQPIVFYIDKIQSVIESFAGRFKGQISLNLRNSKEFLEIMEKVIGKIAVQPTVWVRDFEKLEDDIVKEISDMSSYKIDNITAEIKTFATIIGNYIVTNITYFANDLHVDRDNLLQVLQNLTTVDYSFANEKDKPIVFYIDKIQTVIESFAGRFKEQVSLNLGNVKEFLKIMEKVIGRLTVHPTLWVRDFEKLKDDIVKEINKISSYKVDNITAEIKTFATLIENDILTNITSFDNDLDVDRDNLLQILQNLTGADYSFANEKDKHIVFYIDKIQTVIESIAGRYKEQVTLNLKNSKEFLELMENVIGIITVQPTVWVNDFEKLEDDIVKEVSNMSSGKVDNINAEIKTIATLIKSDMVTNITNFANDKDVDRDNLLQILQNLTTVEYCFADVKDVPIGFYIVNIQSVIESFAGRLKGQVSLNLKNSKEFLEFIEKVIGRIAVQPSVWVRNFEELEDDILKEISSLTSFKVDNITAEIKTYVKLIEIDIVTNITDFANDMDIDKDNLLQILQSLTTIDYSFANERDQPFMFYIDNIHTVIESIAGRFKGQVSLNLGNIKEFLEFMEKAIGRIAFQPSLWVKELEKLKGDSVKNITGLTSFKVDNITAEIKTFAILIGNDMVTNITNFANNLHADSDNLLQILQNLTTVDYSFVNEKDRPIVFYINKIESVMESFAGRFKDQISMNLKNAKEFLEFMEKVIGSIAVQPTVWVKDLEKLEDDTVKIISSLTSFKIDDITTEIKAFAPLIEKDIVTNITNFSNNLNVDRDNLLHILQNLTTADYSFTNQKDQPIIFYIDKIQIVIESFAGKFKEQVSLNLRNAKEFLQLIENVSGKIAFQTTVWVRDFEKLEDDIVKEIIKISSYKVDNITTEIKEFAKVIENDIVKNITNLANDLDVDSDNLLQILQNLITVEYSFANEKDKPIVFYIDKIQTVIESISGRYKEQVSLNLNNAKEFLALMEKVIGIITVQPSVWVNDLVKLKDEIVNKNSVNARLVYDKAMTEVNLMTALTKQYLLEKLIGLKEINGRQNLSIEFVSKIEKANSDLEKKIIESYSLVNVLNLMMDKYSWLHDYSSMINISSLPSIIVFDILSFDWKLGRNWLSPYNTLLFAPMKVERDINKFLAELHTDLRNEVIQSEKIDELHQWWEISKNITWGTFPIFFEKIRKLNMPVSHLFDETVLRGMLNHTGNWERLNFLLESSLKHNIICPAYGSIQSVFVGNYISYRGILKCLPQMQNVKTVVIIAMDTFYLDKNITALEINNQNSLDLMILSPNLWVGSNAIVDVSAPNRPTSANGGTSEEGLRGGTYYGIHQTMNANANYITYKANGGRGGSGAKGQQGSEGIPGTSKNFDANSNDCAAWNGGAIQIRLYPNTCNSGGCCKCHAGNNGVSVGIDGYVGGTGNLGGRGGTGGKGGLGGQTMVVKVDQTQPQITNGAGGSGGPGGAGGLGGPYGRYLTVTVDDVGPAGNKKCKQISSGTKTDPQNRRGPSGGQGSIGSVGGTGSVGQISINKNNYQSYVQQYRTEAMIRQENEFFSLTTIEFLKHLNLHPEIPK